MTTNDGVQPLSRADRIDRRTALGRLLALTLLTPPAVGVLAGCGRHGDQPGRGDGSGMPGWMMSGDDTNAMMADMPAIHDLLVRHDAIRRQVDDIPGGIRARTTSDDPPVARLIQTHVQQMKARIEAGRPIRADGHALPRDHRALPRHHDDGEPLPGWCRGHRNLAGPAGRLLIRQHAHRAVSEFVARRTDRAMQPTPLPTGYRD